MSTTEAKMYDVWAVNIESGKVRLMAANKDAANAGAIVKMAVMRRGVDEEIFIEAEAGKLKEGDVWESK